MNNKNLLENTKQPLNNVFPNLAGALSRKKIHNNAIFVF